MADFDLTIRRLEPADAAVFRDIRLEALRLSPEAFGSDFASESTHTLDDFASRLADLHVLAGFRGDKLVGMAGFVVERAAKMAHKGFLWGVYVRPAARKAGVAKRLVEAAIELARGKVELIHLTVERQNIHARRLYTGLGFVEYGLDRNARRVDGRTYDDVLMALDLG